MKALAEVAGWPKDLSSKIVDIDQRWQAAKALANARNLSVVHEVGPDSDLRSAIHSMTTTLNSRITGRSKSSSMVVPEAQETPPDETAAMPTCSKKVLAALAAAVALGLGLSL